MCEHASCSGCRFFVRDERPEYRTNGLCYRLPPSVIWITNEFGSSDWASVPRPYMSETDWCGEHKP